MKPVVTKSIHHTFIFPDKNFEHIPYEKFDNTSTDFRDTSTIVTLYFYIPAVQ